MRRTTPALLLVVAVAVAIAGAVLAFALAGRTPREWATYLTVRGRDYGALVGAGSDSLAGGFNRADRLARDPIALPNWFGADPERSVSRNGPVREVSSIAALHAAMDEARPGDVVQLTAGTYRIDDRAINPGAAGTPSAPITLRAARLGDVVLLSNTPEAIRIAQPDWRVENLVMRGVCARDSDCEHAFHVVGGAQRVVISNNRLEDFNAHIKINGEGGKYPDGGVIEANTLIDTRPRETGNPVTPVDLVAADDWRISDNLIADFAKTVGDDASYGGFVKGNDSGNVFERNVVLCEARLRGRSSPRVGLSLGGGGTGTAFFRTGGMPGMESSKDIVRDNLIAFCDDDGIYLNRAAAATVAHNTLIDTAGIVVRFAYSSADVTSNIVDGVIRGRDGATVNGDANLDSPLLGLFVGWHPQRSWFTDPAKLDLRWQTPPSPAAPTESPHTDLCGAMRAASARPGAIEDFRVCLRPAAGN